MFVIDPLCSYYLLLKQYDEIFKVRIHNVWIRIMLLSLSHTVHVSFIFWVLVFCPNAAQSEYSKLRRGALPPFGPKLSSWKDSRATEFWKCFIKNSKIYFLQISVFFIENKGNIQYYNKMWKRIIELGLYKHINLKMHPCLIKWKTCSFVNFLWWIFFLLLSGRMIWFYISAYK